MYTILGTYPPGPFRKTLVLFAQKSSLYLYYLGWKFVHFFVFNEKWKYEKNATHSCGYDFLFLSGLVYDTYKPIWLLLL